MVVLWIFIQEVEPRQVRQKEVLGQKFGFGKRYNEPTYELSRFTNDGSALAVQNLDIRDKFNRTIDDEEDDKQISGVIDDGDDLVPDIDMVEDKQLPG